jgi:hypothetical protein
MFLENLSASDRGVSDFVLLPIPQRKAVASFLFFRFAGGRVALLVFANFSAFRLDIGFRRCQ